VAFTIGLLGLGLAATAGVAVGRATAGGAALPPQAAKNARLGSNGADSSEKRNGRARGAAVGMAGTE